MVFFLQVHLLLEGFFEIMSKDFEKESLLENLSKLSVVSIGPFTSDELKKFNVKNTVAEVHTVAGAFDAMKEFTLANDQRSNSNTCK